MPVPSDFSETLARVDDYGILAEDADAIQGRLELALQGVAATEGGVSVDMGVFDWSKRLIREFKAAIHKEICNPEKGALKDEYQDLFKQALTPDGVKTVASAILPIVSAINPAFAVSTVGIYLAIWLLKVGLNHWCSTKLE